MDITKLSDAELLRLVQEDGEMSDPALQELKLRHYQDVRAFAGFVCPSDGEALARQAWQQAMRLQMQDLDGAVRPRALSAVLRTAAGWVGAGQRSLLKPEFVAWFHAQGSPDPAGFAPPAGVVYYCATSTMARAFDILPGRSQVAVWHRQVEREDSADIERLLGGGTEAVSQLMKRSMQDLFNSYIQIHQEAMVSDACSRYHRMLLAYVEKKSRNTTRDFVSHLEQCAHCASAVNDLRRKPSEFGLLLGEALLPWGGPGYAVASREAAAAKAAEAKAAAAEATTSAAPQLSAPQPPAAQLPPAPPSPDQTALVRLSPPAVPGTDDSGVAAGERAVRRGSRPATPSGPVGPADPAGVADEPRRRGLRAPLLVAMLVVLGLLVVGGAYMGGLWLRGAENSGSERPGGTAPKPSKRADEKPGKSPGSQKPSESRVKNAALVWLFDKVDDGKTPDISGNDFGGQLDGDPPAVPVKNGLLKFDGRQAVLADGPVVDTTESFSVSARVKPADSDEDALTVASQYAQRASGFSLEYLPETRQWEMSMPREDAPEADRNRVISETRTEPGEWIYLTGVYDQVQHELRLYIDGSLEAKDGTVFREAIEGDGDFAVARGTADDSPKGTLEGFFEGTIDEVRVFKRALTPGEAGKLR